MNNNRVGYNQSVSFSQVIPRSEGLFTVTVYDLCLDSTIPATLHVQVSDLYGVDVNVVNKVEQAC